MNKKIYSWAMLVLPPIIAPFFLLRERGRARLLERFGFWQKLPVEADNIWWFHGASVGEISGLIPVIEKVKKAKPDIFILVTATSVTGLERAEASADFTALLPADSYIWFNKVLTKLEGKLKVFISSETELWINLIESIKKLGIPMFLVNARISDYTVRRYGFFKKEISKALQSFDKIFLTEKVAETRFLEFGVNYKQLLVTGNTKYSFFPQALSEQEKTLAQAKIFRSSGFVLVLGSIRPGEEKIILPVIKKMRSEGKQINLLVVPRHAEKFQFFKEALREYNFNFVNNSDLDSNPELSDNFLVDTFAKLFWAYSLGDAAFIGATFVDIGGHNPLEPASTKLPVLFGPFTNNIKDLALELQNSEGGFPCANQHEFAQILEKLYSDAEFCRLSGQQAFSVYQRHTAAADLVLKAVTEHLGGSI